MFLYDAHDVDGILYIILGPHYTYSYIQKIKKFIHKSKQWHIIIILGKMNYVSLNFLYISTNIQTKHFFYTTKYIYLRILERIQSIYDC